MGKYEPLAGYLQTRAEDSWNASFAQIEERLGFPLPRSAREHRAWWANQANGNHSQTAGWQKAGWETRDVDLCRGMVRFERKRDGGHDRPTLGGRPSPTSDLWQQASRISGIEDHDKLIDAALTALIQREAARSLARMGGSMPDAQAAPRERPFA